MITLGLGPSVVFLVRILFKKADLGLHAFNRERKRFPGGNKERLVKIAKVSHGEWTFFVFSVLILFSNLKLLLFFSCSRENTFFIDFFLELIVREIHVALGGLDWFDGY
jgi:hypothetical protein